jgi:phosphatidylglycerol:prolipoprotein diacylglycerol transferase
MKFPTELWHDDYLVQGGTPVPLPPNVQHSQEIIAWFEDGRGGRQALEAMLHPRHPSQLYEAFGEGLFLTLILLWVRLKFPRLPHGIITGLFFLLYALARISLENVREPDSGSHPILGMTHGQFFSTFMIVTGLAFVIFGWLRGRRIRT